MIVFIVGFIALLIARFRVKDIRKCLVIMGFIQVFMILGIITIILSHEENINETILSSTEKELSIIQMDTGDYYMDSGEDYIFVTERENGNIGKLILDKREVEFKKSNDIKLVRRDWIAMITKYKNNNPYRSDVVNKYKYILYSDLK